MSNLLERAIVDAKALKDAALRNAEQLVVEKYSLEVKEAMNRLLEQEEELQEQEGMLDAGGMEDMFAADTTMEPEPETSMDSDMDSPEDAISTDDVQAQIPDAFNSDDDQMIQIKLDSLDDELEDEEGPFAGDDKLDDDEIGIDIETEEDPDEAKFAADNFNMDAEEPAVDVDISSSSLEEIIADALQDVLSENEEEEKEENEEETKQDRFPTNPKTGSPVSDPDVPPEAMDEEIDLDELMERVRVEGLPQKSGWAGTPESIMQEYESMLLAREQDSEVKEKNAELRKAVAELQKENKTLSSAAIKLQEQNKEYNTAFNTLQEKLETMNVSNAKLLYINQALENASLNERQKRKVVEAISKAGTVQEAKIVFETMNDTVVTTSDVKKDRTLSEMVSRKSTLLVSARKEQPVKDANPLYNRLQTLAGIKTK